MDAEMVYCLVELLGLARHGDHSMRGWNDELKKWCYLPNLVFLPRQFVINAFTHCLSSHGGLMFVGYLDNMGGKGFVCNLLMRWYVDFSNITNLYKGRESDDNVVLRAWDNERGFTLYIYKSSW